MTDDSSNSSATSPTVTGGSSTALMLWGHQIIQPKNELDSGMMPPPSITMPMSARRPSLSGMITCNGTGGDHVSPPLLKTEMMDEGSQSSLITAESMDHFAVTNENSMDSNSAQQAPHQMQAAMSIMETNPLELIIQKNATMNNSFTNSIATETSLNSILDMNATGIDLRVKQEEQQIAAQIAETLVNNTNVAENNKILSAVAQQSEQNVNNILSHLDAQINDLKAQVEAAPLFNTTTANNRTTANVLYNNNIDTITQSNNMVSTQSANLHHHHHHHQTIENQAAAFTTHQSLMTEAGTATNINHILSFPAASTTASMLEVAQVNAAPISQDVMLNSQPAVVLNSSPGMLTVTTGNATSLSTNISNHTETDIILNPAISPSMMCQNGSTDANLVTNQVPLGDSALLPVNIVTNNSQSSPNQMMGNLMQPMLPSAATIAQNNPEPNTLHHIPIKQTPVAVKNMILNAAADILSSEPNSISTETTINALMSLTPALSEPQHSQVTQSNMAMMNVNDHQTNVCGNSQQVNTDPLLMASHNPFENQQTQSMNNMFTQSDATTAAAVLNNQLMQNVVAAAVQNDIMQNQIAVTETMMNNYSMPNHHINSQMMSMQATSSTGSLCQAQPNYLNEFQYVL